MPPVPVEYPVAVIVVEPEPQKEVVPAVAVPATAPVQAGGENSSAPISGVEALLVSPSISVVMPLIGVPKLSKALLLAPGKCKSVAEVNTGAIFCEFALPPKPDTMPARFVLSEPRKPKTPCVPLTE